MPFQDTKKGDNANSSDGGKTPIAESFKNVLKLPVRTFLRKRPDPLEW